MAQRIGQSIIVGWLLVLCAGLVASSMASASQQAGAAARPATQSTTPPPATSTTATAPATASQPATVPSTSTAPATAPAATVLTAAEIEAEIQRLEQDKSLAKEVADKAIDLNRQALAELKKADEEVASAERFERERTEAPARLAAIRAQLAQTAPAESTTEQAAPQQLSAAQIDAMLQAERQAMGKARAELDDALAKPQTIAERRTELARLIDDLRNQRRNIDEQLAQIAAGGSVDDVAAAQRNLLRAQRQTIQKRLSASRAEIARDEAIGELISARRELATQNFEQVQQRVRALQEELNQKRRYEAEQAAQEARAALEKAASLHPLIRGIAQENQRLADLRTGPEGLTARLERAEDEVAAARSQLFPLRADLRNIKDKVAVVGSNPVIGQLLRKELEGLPKMSALRQKIRDGKAAISDAQLQLIEMRERQKSLDRIDRMAQEMIRSAEPPISPEQVPVIRAMAADLLQKQRQYVDQLLTDYNTYANRLVDLDKIMHHLVESVQEYADYIQERVLWISSGPALYSQSADSFTGALAWMLDGSHWAHSAARVWAGAQEHVVLTCAVGLVICGLLLSRRQLKRRLSQIGASVYHSSPGFGLTLRAAVLTLLLVSAAPAIIYLLAQSLRQSDTSEFGAALSAALTALAATDLSLGLLIQVCRPMGLLEAHFRWNGRTVVRMRRRLISLAAFLLPLVFIVVLCEAQSIEGHKESMGRTCFIVICLALALAAHRILRPGGEVFQAVGQSEQGWLYRGWRLWHFIALAVPLSLAAISAAGFYYTALRLGWHVVQSIWLTLSLLILNGLAWRWLTDAHGQFLLRRMQGGDDSIRGESPQEAATDIPGVPLDILGQRGSAFEMRKQARQFQRYLLVAALLIGLWLIWSALLPALGAGRLTLWTYTTSQTVPGKDGAPATTMQVPAPVTLLDLIAAIMVVALLVPTVANVSGLMQILLLRHFRFTAGGVYAMTTIVRYILTIAALIAAFGLIGVSWSSVQWLAAAITVGLGFGLQEIFGNFVSGIILLLERPIRVGDIVTVNNIDGVISRIRIRATTIVDFSHRELIVPNKAFITGQVMNWTLSDSVTRLAIPVGVAIGADLKQAIALMEQAAAKCPHVLTTPPPVGLATGMTNNVYTLELRVFTPSLEAYRLARTDLLQRVDEAFRQNGIKMASSVPVP